MLLDCHHRVQELRRPPSDLRILLLQVTTEDEEPFLNSLTFATTQIAVAAVEFGRLVHRYSIDGSE